MRKYIKLLLPICVSLVTSCEGQVKPIGETPLDLEKFSFNTKVSELISENTKAKITQMFTN